MTRRSEDTVRCGAMNLRRFLTQARCLAWPRGNSGGNFARAIGRLGYVAGVGRAAEYTARIPQTLPSSEAPKRPFRTVTGPIGPEFTNSAVSH
jgi:hypothetical protein